MGESAHRHLRYCNPETGESILKTLDFSARLLRAGESVTLHRGSINRVFHLIEGRGDIEVNGTTFDCGRNDTVAAPTYARVVLRNRGDKPCFILQGDDTPVQVKLGFYEEVPCKEDLRTCVSVASMETTSA